MKLHYCSRKRISTMQIQPLQLRKKQKDNYMVKLVLQK